MELCALPDARKMKCIETLWYALMYFYFMLRFKLGKMILIWWNLVPFFIKYNKQSSASPDSGDMASNVAHTLLLVMARGPATWWWRSPTCCTPSRWRAYPEGGPVSPCHAIAVWDATRPWLIANTLLRLMGDGSLYRNYSLLQSSLCPRIDRAGIILS
jgi:hypothetical protein